MNPKSILCCLVPFVCIFGTSSLVATPLIKRPPLAKLSNKTPISSPNISLTPSACCDDLSQFAISGSYLFWQASENLQPYAQVVTKEVVLDHDKGIGSPRGHNTDIKNQWSCGFNVRIGTALNRDHWDLFADWTSYRNNTHNTITASPHSVLDQFIKGLSATENGRGIYSKWGKLWVPANFLESRSGLPEPILPAGPFSKASVQWDLHYDSVNLELGKSFKTQANLVRPFIGVEGSWIKRETKAHYTGYANPGSLVGPEAGGSFETPIFTLEGFDSARFKTGMHWWGVGPWVGVFDEFCLPFGFSLFGEFATALLYGKSNGFSQSSLNHFVNQVPQVYDGAKWTQHRKSTFATHLQMDLGVKWGMCFDHNSKSVYVSAAWEENLWFFNNYSSEVSQGSMNLSLGGVKASAGLSF